MAIPVIMPRQGQSVESCIIGQWYKSVGEQVKEGDLLFSYETDKSSFEEEARADGVLLAVFFEEGDEVPVLSTVAVIGNKGESASEFAPGAAASEDPSPSSPKDEKEEDASKVIEFDVEEDEKGRPIRISPLARNMAAKLNIDPQGIKGTGPRGRIIARDVEAAVDAKPAAVKQQQQNQQPQSAPAPQISAKGASI